GVRGERKELTGGRARPVAVPEVAAHAGEHEPRIGIDRLRHDEHEKEALGGREIAVVDGLENLVARIRHASRQKG
ncbi:MAG: hypothetical protein HOQ09_00255, partial [Gemmatimonadaceae bacterium]|nr:hypothetical protein [Gemmatimonadaceae bacterium]